MNIAHADLVRRGHDECLGDVQRRTAATDPVEYARYGVRVNARCPGAVYTALLRKHLATAEDPDAARRRIESVTPAGRLPRPG